MCNGCLFYVFAIFLSLSHTLFCYLVSFLFMCVLLSYSFFLSLLSCVPSFFTSPWLSRGRPRHAIVTRNVIPLSFSLIFFLVFWGFPYSIFWPTLAVQPHLFLAFPCFISPFFFASYCSYTFRVLFRRVFLSNTRVLVEGGNC